MVTGSLYRAWPDLHWPVGRDRLSSEGMNAFHHFVDAPSPWVVRWSAEIPAVGRVLDLACGAGRHARYLARRGFAVDAVDRDTALFQDPPAKVTLLKADLEREPWPYAGRSF